MNKSTSQFGYGLENHWCFGALKTERNLSEIFFNENSTKVDNWKAIFLFYCCVLTFLHEWLGNKIIPSLPVESKQGGERDCFHGSSDNSLSIYRVLYVEVSIVCACVVCGIFNSKFWGPWFCSNDLFHQRKLCFLRQEAWE